MPTLGSDLVQLVVIAAVAALGVVLAVAVARPLRRPTNGRTIRVVGVGSGGANAVEAAMRGRRGAEYVSMDTDAQALRRSATRRKLLLGKPVTLGRGSGGDPSVGATAARDSADDIARLLEGSDLVVVVAGLGGGTGSGAVPVVAEIAREQGALTVVVATKPFEFEGTHRRHVADAALRQMVGKADAVAMLPNDRVREVVSADASVEDAFRAIDESQRSSVQAIVDMVARPGRINLDFANARSALRDRGPAFVGVGRASGEHRAAEAARKAMEAALLEVGAQGAESVVLNVAASRQLKLSELDEAVQAVLAEAGPRADVVFGMTVDGRLKGVMQVTLIASGFDAKYPADDASAAGWLPVWRRDRNGPVATEAETDETPHRQSRRRQRALSSGGGVAGETAG